MARDEFRKNFLDGHWYSVVVSKLLDELIQSENEEIHSSYWYKEEGDSDGAGWKRFYYIVTNKRFFEICVDSGSFSYKSYFLKLLNGFREVVVPHESKPNYFENSAYFLGRSNGVSSYTVEFSFDVAEGESDKVMFSFCASWETPHFEKLRDFVRGFHRAVACL